MDRSRALELLAKSKPLLCERFGVVDLALFGSTLHGTARPDSDVDVLVRFAGAATSQLLWCSVFSRIFSGCRSIL